MLCGGASTRMGRDKATLEVAGRPLAAWVADALTRAGADPVFAVGGPPDLPLPVVPDRHPGEGPLGAIVTALAAAPSGVVAVLACDLPLVAPDPVVALVSGAGADVDVAVAVAGGRVQPLVAAWRTSCLPALEERFGAGERSPRRALDRLRVVEVELADPAWAADVDSPADLARVLGTPRRT